MSQIEINTKVTNGNISIPHIPLNDNTEVKVIVIPKVDLSKMSFLKIRQMTKHIKGNLSDEIISERNER
jgi:hypothetical protein